MIRHKFKDIKMWRPSAGTAVALLIVAGAVAFALLQSQVQLGGNSIQTDSAGLLISRDGSSYSSSATGYAFVHIIPGSKPSQTEHFMLQNTGSAPLAINLGMPSAPDNPNDLDLGKVSVIITPHGVGAMPGSPQSFTLQSLMDAADGVAVDGPALDFGTTEEFDIQVAMDPDAVSGEGVALSGLNLTFTGVAVSTD